jgi:hypothetical protein
VLRKAIMSVVECDVPRHSAVGKDLIERADFRDAYRAPLNRSDLSVVEIFFEIFARRPGWMNLMLIARNKAAALAGLEVPTTSEIMNMERRDRYLPAKRLDHGQSFLSARTNSLQAGTTSTLDFRLSIMKVHDGVRPSVVVSTLCMVHNKFGQYYLSCIIPVHKFGLRRLIASALAARRL